MKAATSPTYLDGARYTSLERLRQALRLAAGPLLRLSPERDWFPSLCRAARTLGRAGEWAGFRTADSLDPHLEGIALRELIRACGPPLNFGPRSFMVDNEAEIREWQRQGAGVFWCGLHHALGSLIVRVLELWDWPCATLAIQASNPAWGGSGAATNASPGPLALLKLRRAAQEGFSVVAMLDQGRQSRPRPVLHPGPLALARVVQAPLVIYRAELDGDAPLIRIRTRLVPPADCSPAAYDRQARAAVEALYGASWGLKLDWKRERSNRTSKQSSVHANMGSA